MKKRDTSLDVIRILACFLVVLMHSPIPSENADGPFLVALSYLTAPCIGLFFMVSGALLLPVKTDYFTFIRRRFSKIAVPTIIWSIIYMGMRLYRSESEINLIRTLASLPFCQAESVLWFMYTLSGLYLLTPILSAWVEKATKKELQLVLALWAVTLCYPIFDFWLITNTSSSGILYYFTGYAGYFLLGFYLRKYPDSLSAAVCGVIALSGMILIPVLKRYDVAFDFYSLFWYLSVFIAAFVIWLWKIVKRLSMHLEAKQWLANLSNLTFGIYLIHILVMRHWLWHREWLLDIGNYPMQCLAIAAITFILSAMFCLAISYIPYSQWIIAYRRKQWL